MMMKSGLSGPFLLLLLLSSTVSGLGSVVSKYYSYIQSFYTWQDAQRHCSTYHNDLATIYTQSDEDLINIQQYHAWIGLHRSTGSSSTWWYWSNGQYHSFYNWAGNEPYYSENCATVYYSSKRFYGNNCGGYFFFYCQEQHPKHYKYLFIPLSMTWSEAQQYCRSEYDDLAAFTNYSNMSSTVKDQDFPVWIGLHRDGGTWKWSLGSSEYRRWASGEPGNNGNCVSISSKEKKMATQDCSARLPFVCLKDNVVLVKENKTWEEALEHCRALRSEILSVQPGDHSHVMSKVMEAGTEEVWTGLRFLAGEWLWVNGASMAYSDLPLCPPFGQYCGALSKNNTGSIEPADCTERRNFLCYT